RERQRSVSLDRRCAALVSEGGVILWSWKLRRVASYIDRRREGDHHANGHKQKQVKGASKKMRFDVWISLLFHYDLAEVHRRKQRERRFLLFGISARPLFTSLPSVKMSPLWRALATASRLCVCL